MGHEALEELAALLFGPGGFMALMGVAAVFVAVGKDNRRGLIALWVAQLAAGAVLLGAGSEMVAIICWISSSLVCSVYFLNADLLAGQSEASPEGKRSPHAARVFPALVSIGFGVLVWALFDHAAHWRSQGTQVMGPVAHSGADEQAVLMQLLALFSLAAAVGGGVISRARRGGA